VPVAANCCVFPSAIEEFNGDNAMEDSAAGVTVTVVEPSIGPELAVIIVCPVDTLAASPRLGGMLLIVATAGTELFQVAEPVRSRVLPSV
jgi:hypothetical protein